MEAPERSAAEGHPPEAVGGTYDLEAGRSAARASRVPGVADVILRPAGVVPGVAFIGADDVVAVVDVRRRSADVALERAVAGPDIDEARVGIVGPHGGIVGSSGDLRVLLAQRQRPDPKCGCFCGEERVAGIEARHRSDVGDTPSEFDRPLQRAVPDLAD